MLAILIICLVIFGAISLPIGIAMGLATMLCLVFATNIDPIMVAQNAFAGIDSFSLMAIPFFMLAGNFMRYGGISKRLLDLADNIVGFFTGGLGAGKTAFTEGLAEGLGCTDPVSSPTFAIVNYYRGPRPLAHFDLYRISTENDLCAAGFYDYLDQGAVVAAEWSENFADLLALENPIRVNIERLDDTTRRITIEGVTV